MEAMSSGLKERIHALVDSLPEAELPAARRYLEYLRDVTGEESPDAEESEAFAAMPDNEVARLNAALEQSEQEFADGRGVDANEVLRELRASR